MPCGSVWTKCDRIMIKHLLLIFLSLNLQERVISSYPADSLQAVPDTAFVLGYRASQGDGVATAQLQLTSKKRLSEVEKKASMLARLKAMRQETGKKAGRTAAGSAPVKEIPFQETITPTGALVYTVPIATASDCNFAPNISLVYNSQGGNGVAGFGWNISGLSAITIRNKNLYYDGVARAADWQDRDGAVWSLDGEVLVQNEDISAFPGYQFQAVRNRTMVKRFTSGTTSYNFEALFPDGHVAKYGGGIAESQKKTVFPVSIVNDICGNSIYVYYYTDDYESPAVSEILYGDQNEEDCTCRMVFTYEAGRNDLPARYVAGAEVRQNRLLKTITSYDGDNEICTYNLTHTLQDSVWMLTRIDCSRGGSSLNPLLFSYGDEESLYQQQGIAEDPCSTFLDHYFDNTDDDKKFIYLRGKFLPNSFSDGIVIYPEYSIYKQKIKDSFPPAWDYESEYREDQPFLVVPSIGTGLPLHPLDSIFAGANFQALQAVDVDGDANDELVRVNVASARANYTDYQITVFKFEDNPWRLSSLSFTVTVKGSKKTSSLYSPTQRAFFFGDFLGNGKAQLLAFSYKKNYNDDSQAKYCALIDLEAGMVLSDETICDCSANDAATIFAADIDGDGRTELVNTIKTDGGTEVYLANASGHFSLDRHLSVLTSTMMRNTERQPFFLDHNGDGYLDFIIPPKEKLKVFEETASKQWTLYTGNGSSFSPRTIEVTARLISSVFSNLAKKDNFFFTDITRDGIADMIRTREGVVSVFPGTPEGFSSTPLPVTAALNASARSIVPQNVASVGGIASLICVDAAYVRIYNGIGTSTAKRSLNYAVDSYSRGRMNEYQEMGDPTGWVYYNDGTYTPDIQGGYAKMWVPIRLLSERTLFDCSDPEAEDVTILDSRQRVYHNASWNREGLGFCGFSATDDYVRNGPWATHSYLRTEYKPELFGVVKSTMQAREFAKTDTVTFTANVWDSLYTAYGKARPRLASSFSSDRLSGLDVSQSFTYDAFDNPVATITTRTTNLGDVKIDTLSVTYLNNFTSSSGHYVLGAHVSQSLFREGWEKRSENTLDTEFRPARVREYAWRSNPADSLRTLTDTRLEYDSFGNVTRRRVSTHGTGSYLESTYTYDGDARFLLTETDPLGLTTTYSNYNVFGKPAQITDAKGRSTHYTYDSWGALTRTDRPDGSWTASSTQWCGGTEPGLYKVTSEDCTGAMTSIYYDVLCREIQTAGKRFDGQWQCRRNEYDSRGLLSRVSLPYRRSAPADTATALLWNNYLYDVYGRDTCVAEASGRRSRTIYDRTVTTTVRDGITSTATVDALGRTALVHDAGGDIVYSYRPDGNPSSVSVHSGVTTSFGYNGFGERSFINDPSLGLQTDSTAWNADGSSVTTSTNVYGTTRSTSDRYGRLMTVEKIGEDTTTYSYDAYNLLTGLSSTNGTAIAYGYDAYDRLAHETEYHGTDSLRKAYTYNALGQLASKTYTSNFVYMPVTENYTYANGHNTTTTAFIPEVPDVANEMTFTVKQLLSENEFGQPTSVLVGTNTRSYSYNQYGLPTSRSVGPTWTESYAFDASMGNLTHRTQTIGGIGTALQEYFSYDALGRLSGVSGTPPAAGSSSGSTTYDNYSNATQITNAASMQYNDALHPYTLTSYIATDPDYQKNLTIGYNVDGKPSSIENTNYDASISYGFNGDRTAMLVHNKSTDRVAATRQYYGSCMEVLGFPSWPDQQISHYPFLYLGGDYYDAPVMVEFMEEPGDYNIHTIWRDYLGSVRDVCDYGSSYFSEPILYDAWGRGRDTEDVITMDTFGGVPPYSRGFGGHEYLPWFGIYNANARLYDPLLGRFLSPDPYVQAPDFSVNFNRYAWCLNNPLKYTDPDGEFVITTAVIVGLAIGATIGAYSGAVIANGGQYNPLKWNYKSYETWGGMLYGAAIGGAASFAGAAVGASVAAGVGIGGFAGGAISGAAAGVVSGSIQGFGMGLYAGEGDLGYAAQFGLIGMAGGAVAGGLIGGTAEGISALRNGRTFWTGTNNSPKSSITPHGPLGEDNHPTVQEKLTLNPKNINSSYDLEPNPDGGNVTLYRGVTGSEHNNDVTLFMTDDPSYAATYSKVNGEVMKVTIPKETLERMYYAGDLSYARGLHTLPSDYGLKGISGNEFIFSQRVKPYIVGRFIPY